MIITSREKHNVIVNLDNFHLYIDFQDTDEITIGDGKKVPISHIGSSTISLNNDSFVLNDILCAANSCQNLVYAFVYRNNCVSIEFFPNFFIVNDMIIMKHVFYKGQNNGRLYTMHIPKLTSNFVFAFMTFLVSFQT